MLVNEMFSEIFKRLRTEKKMTQNDLAEKLNCNRQKIADLERGKSSPSIFDLMNLSDIFGVSTDYLLGLTNAKTTDKDIQFICDYIGLDEEAVKSLHIRAIGNISDVIEFESKELLNHFVYKNYFFEIEHLCDAYITDLKYLKKLYENYYSILKQEKRRDIETADKIFAQKGALDIYKFRLQELNKDFVKEYTKDIQKEVDVLVKKIRQEEIAFIEQRDGDTDGNHTQT